MSGHQPGAGTRFGSHGNVELAKERAAVRAGDPSPRIGLDAAHVRKVDHEAAFAAGQPGCCVAAGLDRDLEVVLAREGDGGLTSWAFSGRAMSDGRRSWIAFQRRRALS